MAYQSETSATVLLLCLLIVGASSKVIFQADISSNRQEINVYRQMVVRQNLRIIQEHNANPHKTFTMKAYPQFVALTLEEFGQLYVRGAPKDTAHIRIHPPSTDLKDKLKRRAGGQVGLRSVMDLSPASPTVYNQGVCGNCYAFATVEGVNMFNRIWKPTRPRLSIEEVTDCTNNPNLPYQNYGCNGGSPQYVLWYMAIYGIVSEAVYPLNPLTYQTGQAQPCRTFGSSVPRFKIQNWYAVQTTDCSLQLQLLNYYHPVTTAMMATTPLLQNYGEGIITGCSNVTINQLDHAVLMVGYNLTDPQNSYLKVKNSWGTGWGDEGYFKISVSGNECGICYRSVSSF